MKFEMHSHVKEQSTDAKVSASEYIALLQDKGYNGMVITDHFDSYQLYNTCPDEGLLKQCSKFLDGYRALKNAAIGTSIVVLLGMEYTLEYESGFKHILLYGLTEEMIENGLIRPYMSLAELRDVCLKNDVLIIQSHPMRYGEHVLPIEYVDGYEVVNSKPRRDYYATLYNERIQEYVKGKDHLINIGGGDCHNIEDVGRGGIDTLKPICDMNDMKHVLRNGNYKIIW